LCATIVPLKVVDGVSILRLRQQAVQRQKGLIGFPGERSTGASTGLGILNRLIDNSGAIMRIFLLEVSPGSSAVGVDMPGYGGSIDAASAR
jgi:hypothetical protein